MVSLKQEKGEPVDGNLLTISIQTEIWSCIYHIWVCLAGSTICMTVLEWKEDIEQSTSSDSFSKADISSMPSVQAKNATWLSKVHYTLFYVFLNQKLFEINE